MSETEKIMGGLMPGDWVKVRDEVEGNVIVGRYGGELGCIIDFTPEAWYPFLVKFDDGKAYRFGRDELVLSVEDMLADQVDIQTSESELVDHELADWEKEILQEAAEASVDMVNHPSHYAEGWSNGAEIIDITEHLNFNRGNAVKYIARAGKKDQDREVEDLKKAQFYINREIARLEAEGA